LTDIATRSMPMRRAGGLDGDLDLVPTPSSAATRTGVLEARRLQIEQAAEPADFGVGARAGAVARTIGLMRSTRRLPASMSTPESA